MKDEETGAGRETFGAALSRFRMAAKLTQEELADRAGLSARAISDLERGARRNPRLATVRRLADGLELTPDDRECLAASAQGASEAETLTLSLSEMQRHPAAGQFAAGQSRAARKRNLHLVPDVPGEAIPETTGQVAQVFPTGGFLGGLPEMPMVGRLEELNRILTSAYAALSGAGRFVLAVGEPGLGKTRLAQEIMVRLHEREFLIAIGRCYESRTSIPYFPFLDALATVYEYSSPTLRTDVARRWPYLMRLLPSHERQIPLPRMGDEEDRDRLFRAVAGFLDAAATERPIALLLDDLHWADGATLDLLPHLARHTRGVAVLTVGFYRGESVSQSHPLRRVIYELHRDGLVERVPLRRLEPSETGQLIESVLAGGTPSESLVELIHQRSEGNPFFAKELLRALLARGSIHRHGTVYEVERLSDVPVPEHVFDVISERFSRLSEPTRDLLEQGSVLGQVFAREDLMVMAPVTSQAFDEAVDEGAAVDFIRPTQGTSYAFNHALTQRVLYDGLSASRRRSLHLAAGTALEQLIEPERERRAGEIAQHFRDGGDIERGLRYTLLAGDQALSVFALGEAEGQYRNALELSVQGQDAGRQAEALEKLASILSMGSRHSEAVELLARAVELRRTAGNLEAEAVAIAQLSLEYSQLLQPDEAVAVLESGLGRFDSQPPSLGEARLNIALVEINNYRGANLAALAAAERAMAILDQLERTPDVVHAAAQAARAYGMTLSFAWRILEARAALTDAAALAEETGDQVLLGSTLMDLGLIECVVGDGHQGLATMHRSIEVLEPTGHGSLLGFVLAHAAWALIHLGEWTAAEEYLERARAAFQSGAPSWMAIYLPLMEGWLSLVQGNVEQAQEQIEEGVALAGPAHDLRALDMGHFLLAVADLRLGRPQDALRRVEALIAQHNGDDGKRLHGMAAWALMELDRLEEAVVMAPDAARYMKSIGEVADLPMQIIVQGMVAARSGRLDEAERCFREALLLAQAYPNPYDEANALRAWGMTDVMAGRPLEGLERLRQALAMFERLGAALDARETRELLSQMDRTPDGNGHAESTADVAG